MKQDAILLIRSVVNTLIGEDNYIILQYGSSLFGSETKDSDFDIIILCTYMEMSKHMSKSKDLSIRD